MIHSAPPAENNVIVARARRGGDRIETLTRRLGDAALRHLTSPATLICLVAALVILLRGFTAVAESRRDFTASEQRAQREAANLAQAFEEHAGRLFRSVERDLTALKRHGATPCDPQLFERAQQERATTYPIAVFDAAGKRCAGSAGAPGIGGRPAMVAHAQGGTGLRFDPTTSAGAQGGPWIPVSVRLQRADGSFTGVALIDVNTQDLTGFYSKVDMGLDGTAMLALHDGTVLARLDGFATRFGKRIDGNARLRQARAGAYRGTDGVDAVERFYHSRQVGERPLIVMAGLSVEEELAGATARRGVRITALVLTTLVLGMGALGAAVLLPALARSRRQAHDAERLKREFLGVMSHELRTPLNGILGFSDLLQKHIVDERGRQFLDVIRNSGEQLQGLIEDLLTFAELEAGRLKVQCRDESVIPIIERLAALHARRVEDKGLGFSTTIAADAPPTAWCDSGRTMKILDHLVQNATKFTSRGSVQVRVSAAGDEMLIEVADTGSGIGVEAQKHLAQSFRQADGSITRDHGGVGLGLALCAGLARLMQMRFEFSSTEGQGATFRLYIHTSAPTLR